MGRATQQFCRLPLYPVLSNLYLIDSGFRSPQPVEYLVQATVPELFPAEGVGGNACASRLERKPPAHRSLQGVSFLSSEIRNPRIELRV